MSAQVTILQLPAAGAITGTEAVPIVQNGVTVQTTTGAITNSPSQTYTYLTVTQTPQLPNSRYIGATNGLTVTDGGIQGVLNITTSGALLSLVNAGTGFQVKTSSTTLTGRSIVVSSTGLSITDGDGIAGNPTIALTGQVLNLANASINGFMVLTSAGAITSTTLTGTANQISIANPTGIGNPVFSIADNAVMPGTGAMTIPKGTSGQQPVASVDGMIRYDTSYGAFYGYSGGSWNQFSLSGGVTQVNTGTGLTGGPITGVGTISIDNTTVTYGSYGSTTQVGTFTVNAQGQLTAAANVTISASGIGAVTTINGTANEITASGASTVTLSLPAALTFTGKTVTGGTFNMTAATVGADTVTTNTATQTLTNKTLTAPVISTIVNTGTLTLPTSTDTLVGRATTDTLTNKTISGASNTLTNIGNASLTNSSVTVGTTAIALGASSLTLGGLTSVAVTQDPTSALQLATKQYVDAVAEGLHVHASCAAATTGTLASITGGTVTYNNGASGVGATLTLSVALTVLDGYTLLNGDRVLVKNEATQANNGIYTWATGGTVLTRATDFDTAAEMASGDFTFVSYGTLYGSTGWVQTDPVTVVGTSPVTWIQFSGSGAYTAGTGLTLTGTQFSITNTAVTAAAYGSATQVGTFTVNAQGQLTLAGNTTVTPAVGSITGLGTGVATVLAIAVGSAGAFVTFNGALGTPSSGTLTNATGLPVSTGISGFGTGVATALAVNVGSAGAFVVNGGALGTPSSGTVTNLTGTASININGTVGATTPATGAFTTISASGVITSTVVTGTAPFTVASTTAVANLTSTNTVTTAITADSTNATNYLTFVNGTSGNLGQLVNSSITCNPSTGVLTGGISGGTF
jgi:hypothetical protein